MPQRKKTKDVQENSKNGIVKSDYEKLSENIQSYKQLFSEIKDKVKTAHIKAAVAVNQELITLYWEIGRSILNKQNEEGWGSKTIARLAKDLKSAFPGMTGFSPRNVQYMVTFAREYPELSITQQAVAQIPWGHNVVILDKVKKPEQRIWYIQQTIENGWSRSMLLIWIENDLYGREGKAITNFKHALPSPQSDLAQQITKDPYCFQFLSMEKDFREKELEQGLIDHIQKLLMEFGRGFAFVGRQVSLEVDGKDFVVDLLFYHTALHCYVVAELKIDEFQPEFAGKMNFYLGAVDRLLKKENDNPTIGLILCKSKSKIQVEIALQDIKKPIGVSDYLVKIEKSVPKELVSSLPTIEEIEAELEKDT